MGRRLRNFVAALALGIALSYASAKAAEPTAMITTANLNIRSGAGTSYSIVGSFPKNTTITVLSINNGWAKTEYKGQIVYCSADYLKEASCTEMVTTTTLNVRSGAGTDYSKVGLLASNTKVKVTSISGNWAQIIYNNKIYYCCSDYLKVQSTASTETDTSSRIMVTITELNVRTGPGTTYAKVAVLPSGYEAKVIRIDNGWAKIRYNGQELYCSANYLKAVEGAEYSVMVATTYLNVRVGPGISYDKIGLISTNESVKVIRIDNGWAKISYNGQVAYCSAQYLKETMSNTPQEKKYFMLTCNTYLNVRTGRSTTCDKIGMLSPGDQVKVVGISDGWAEIIYNGSLGYCSASYLEGYDTVVVTADQLNVRSGPGVGYSIIGELNNKDRVERIAIVENGWSAIIYNGHQGYCSSNYLASEKNDSNNDSFDYNTNALPISLDSFVTAQLAKGNTCYTGEEITKDYITTFINPSNLMDKSKIYQFLKLNVFRNSVNVNELNNYLNSLGQDNIFYNKGQAFVDAAKENEIDTLYLVAHTMLETGYGKSELAKGVLYTAEGQEPVMVYNLFGIGAVNSNPLQGGAKTAYENGWTSIEAAIKGGAKWISSNYIHSTRTNQHQYTLYMMRWNTNGFIDARSNCIWHQYATDVNWANAVASVMNKISYIYKDVELDLEIPSFR